MSESSIKNGFSAANADGKIIDENLARQMADREDEMREEHTADFKKEMPDLSSKEIEETVAPAADKAAEGVFKKETGTEYADAVREAQVEAAYEMNAVNNSVKGETEKDVEIIKLKPGAEGKDNSDANNAVENYQDAAQNAKIDSETKIASVVSRVETKEANQDRLNKVKKEVKKRIIEIQKTIDILDGKKGGRGEVLTYLKKIAGIKDRDLTEDEEKKYWGRAMYRLKAEKQGYEVVDLFFENNDSPADWEKFQKHLRFSLKSEKSLADEDIHKIDKDPAVSKQNKSPERRKKEAMRDSKARQDVISGFIDKNDEKKEKQKPVAKPKTLEEIEGEIIKRRQEIENILKGVAEADGDEKKISKLKNAIDWREREIRSNEEKVARERVKKNVTQEPSKNPTESESDEAEIDQAKKKDSKIKTAFGAAVEDDPFGHWKESQEPAKEENNEVIPDIKELSDFKGTQFKQWDKIKVRRTSGAIEDDWSVGFIDRKEGLIKAFKDGGKKGEMIEKWIPITELAALNLIEPKDNKGEEEKELTEEDIKNINAQWELSKSTLKSFQDVLSKEKDDAKKKELQYQIEYIIKTQKSTAENVVEKLGTKFTKEELVKGENLLKKHDKQREELIRAGVPNSLMTPEEKQEYYDAQSQKDYFIDVLMSKGFSGEIAKDIYNQFVFDNLGEEEKEQEHIDGYPAVIEAGPKVELNKEQSAKVEEILKEFDLTAEDAEKIEGFRDLSYEQRLLALENLKQMTLREIQDMALTEHRQKTEQTQEKYAKSKSWLSKVGLRAKMIGQGATKYLSIAMYKSLNSGLIKKDYEKILQNVVEGMREITKYDVEEKKGKLEIQYLSGLENLNDQEKVNVNRLNEIANELGRMPLSLEQLPMGLLKDKHTRAQKIRYEKLRAEYEQLLEGETKDGKSNQGILGLLERQARLDLKKEGKDDSDRETRIEALTQAGELENIIRLNRFFIENPDVEKELKSIKSGKIFTSVLKDTLAERGALFGFGLAARAISIKALTALGIASSVTTGGVILVSAAGIGGGIGGWRGWRRAEESLREMDAQARGEDFKSKESRGRSREILRKKQMENAVKKGEVAYKTITNKRGETIKVMVGIELSNEERMEKNIVDADSLANRLEALRTQIEKTSDEIDESVAKEGQEGSQTKELIDKRFELAHRLETRLGYTRRKLDGGLVNFGKNEEQAFNQMTLVDKLNLAVNCVELHRPTTETKLDESSPETKPVKDKELLPLEKRLERFLNFKKDEINKARRWHKLKQMGKGAAYGMVFAGAGASVRWFLEHYGIVGGGHIPPHEGSTPDGDMAGYESGKGPEMFPGEKYFGVEANPEKVKNLIDQFNEEYRFHPEWKGNTLEQARALEGLRQQLETAGIKDSDTLKEILADAKEQLNGDGNVFIVKGGSQEAQNLAGIESTGGSGGGSTAEQTATAAGAGKSVDAVVGAKTEAAQFINEIKNVGGIKHDSIWRSTHDLIREHAKEMGMEYPGKGGAKLSEVEWYNLKTSQLVNELDKNTTGGIKDLVYEGNKMVAEKGSGGNWRINIEQSSGFTPGRLADLHHNVAGAKAPAIENESSDPEFAPIHPEPIWEPMINEPQATDHPWDNWPKQAAGNRLNEIFDYPFGPQGAETTTYQYVNGDSAEAFLKRDFFKEIAGNHELDVSEKDALMHDVTKYRELQNYLNDMAKKPGNYPRTGETVDQFIHRLNRDIAITPEHAVPDAAPGKTMPVPEAQNKIEIDKIDEDFFKENQAAEATQAESSGGKTSEIEQAAKIETSNNIKIDTDKFSGDIKFKYDASGNPTELLPIDHEELRRITGSEYFDKSNLKSFDYLTKADGKDLVARVEIFKQLSSEKDFKLADVVLEDIKKIATQLDTRHNGIVDYSKFPQVLREKLGK